MNKEIIYLRYLLPVLLICCATAHPDDEILHEILAWSMGVKTYSGEFETHVQYIGYSDPDPKLTAQGQLEKIWRVKYKTDGVNRYMEGSAIRGDVVEFDGFRSMLDGVVTVYDKSATRADINGAVNDWGMSFAGIITPEVLFGNYDWTVRLTDCYTNGHTEKYQLSDTTIVYTFRVPPRFSEAIDVYWDISANHVRQIDMVDRPMPEKLPKLLETWDRPPFELRSVHSTLEFFLVEETDGIHMPTHALMTVFDTDKAESKNLSRQFHAGEIDEEAYCFAYNLLPVHPIITLEYFLKSCTLNVPLTKADFEFDIPPGTFIADQSSGESYELPSVASRITAPKNIMIVAALIVTITAAGLGIYVYRKRKTAAAA